MIRLSSIQILNFRGIDTLNVELLALTPLIGKNNSGKSSVVAAIKWVLSPASLTAEDFHDRARPVVIAATLQGITQEVLGEILPNHASQLAPYIQDGQLSFRRVQATPGAGVRAIQLEVFHSADAEWRNNPTGIPQAFASITPEVIHLQAMDDAAEDVASNKNTTTIGKLLGRVIEPIARNHGDAVGQALATIGRRLGSEGDDRAPELAAFDEGANRHIAQFFPGITIKAHVPTPDLASVLKAGTIKVFESEGHSGRDVTSMGHGAQRAIQMALLHRLADAGRGPGPDTCFTVLLIDEPELYLHPQAVTCIRDALRFLARTEYQVVFSTHSPLMLDDEGLAATTLLYKDERVTRLRPSLRSALHTLRDDAPSQVDLLLSIDNLNVALFADEVVLIEGQTESRCLPTLIEAVAQQSLASLGVGLVRVRGAEDLPKSHRVLKAMGRSPRIVTDLDFAFRGAVRMGLFQESDPHLVELRRHLQTLAASGAVSLDSGGLPTRGVCSAEEAMIRLSRFPSAQSALDGLVSAARAQGLWLWRGGAIEPHLGLNEKSETEWRRFQRSVLTNGWRATIPDTNTSEEFVRWLLL